MAVMQWCPHWYYSNLKSSISECILHSHSNNTVRTHKDKKFIKLRTNKSAWRITEVTTLLQSIQKFFIRYNPGDSRRLFVLLLTVLTLNPEQSSLPPCVQSAWGVCSCTAAVGSEPPPVASWSACSRCTAQRTGTVGTCTLSSPGSHSLAGAEAANRLLTGCTFNIKDHTQTRIILYSNCCVVMTMAFSSCARTLGVDLTIHSLPALFWVVFLLTVEISSCTPMPLFRLGLIHSGSASWDDYVWVIPDKFRVNLFPW